MKEQNEKQAIEEMAKDIFDTRVAIDGIDIAFAAVHGADTKDSNFVRIAKHLVIGKGYRKQREWIGVEERFPKESERVLVYGETGISFATRYKGDWLMPILYAGEITHWMPLPEPPKMKGGAG